MKLKYRLIELQEGWKKEALKHYRSAKRLIREDHLRYKKDVEEHISVAEELFLCVSQLDLLLSQPSPLRPKVEISNVLSEMGQ